MSMRRTSAPIYGRLDKEVLGHLDLTDARWQGGEDTSDEEEVLEVAFIKHVDGVTYIAVRRTPPMPPDDHVLVFTPREWEVFANRAAAGYFNPDQVLARRAQRQTEEATTDRDD